jgi:hypothetical protein
VGGAAAGFDFTTVGAALFTNFYYFLRGRACRAPSAMTNCDYYVFPTLGVMRPARLTPALLPFFEVRARARSTG